MSEITSHCLIVRLATYVEIEIWLAGLREHRGMG